MARKPKRPAGKPTVLPTEVVLKFLFDNGYFGTRAWAQVKKIRGKELEKAVCAYQRFNGIDECGCVDEVTAHRIKRRRCGLPDFNVTAKDTVCRWPMKKIAYYHELKLPGCTPDQIIHAYDIAFSQWAKVCDIEPTRVDTSNKANKIGRAHV